MMPERHPHHWAKLPPYFTQDSIERGIFQPENGAWCSEEQLRALLADAEFYCDPCGPDMCPAGLKQSARAVIKRIRKLLTQRRLRP